MNFFTDKPKLMNSPTRFLALLFTFFATGYIVSAAKKKPVNFLFFLVDIKWYTLFGPKSAQNCSYFGSKSVPLRGCNANLSRM